MLRVNNRAVAVVSNDGLGDPTVYRRVDDTAGTRELIRRFERRCEELAGAGEGGRDRVVWDLITYALEAV